MNISVFGKSLGQLLAKNNNLNSAYIPDRVDVALAKEIVVGANRSRPQKPPYAILVSNRPENTAENECLELNEKSSISYRHGDRLAVVLGSSAGLQSFTKTYKNLLPVGFPDSVTSNVNIFALSEITISNILENAGIDSNQFVDEITAAQRLSSALKITAETYKRICDGGGKDWNVFWYEHSWSALERLQQALIKFKEFQPEFSVNEAFEKLTFASFGLPKPANSMEYRFGEAFAAKEIEEALDQWWNSSDRIIESITAVNNHPNLEGVVHPVTELDWSNFDQQKLASDNSFTAFSNIHSDGFESVLAFAELEEDQFFNPLSEIKDAGKIEIFSNNFLSREINQSANSPYFAEIHFDNQDSNLVTSETLRIRIPSAKLDEPLKISPEQILLKVTDSRFKWFTHKIEYYENNLELVGEFTGDFGTTPFKNIFKSLKVTLELTARSDYLGLIDSSSSCNLYFIPPMENGLAVFKVGGNKKLSGGNYVGPVDRISDSQDTQSLTLNDNSSKIMLLVWANTAILENKPLERISDSSRVFTCELTPSPVINLQLDDSLYVLRTPEARAAEQSPVIAAIQKDALTDDSPAHENLISLRGQVETLISHNLASGDWLQALGHIVLPTDRDAPIGDLSSTEAVPILMNSKTRNIWNSITDFEVEQSFSSGEEVQNFIESFKRLEIENSLQERSGPGVSSPDWPSRTSWRHLFLQKKAELETYLEKYTQLVAAAKLTKNPHNIFWATYPFSVSAWNTGETGNCEAILLTPLHPLRLAWLASVEQTFFESEISSKLAGTVEGWNIPFFGPSTTSSGAMVAVPMDSGKDQLFLGWSMLVRASVDEQAPLESPSRICNFPAPGSAASGMNSSAAEGALRAYRKINPHVTTMTIDLAALKKTSRLSEIDDAVLNSATLWAQDKDKELIGGVRVWDSLLREGEPPLNKIPQITNESNQVPASWMRYKYDASETKKCNVRLLQDSGVRVSVKTTGESGLGVMGNIPLRRFEAQVSGSENKRLATISPTIQPDQGWQYFTSALREFENANARPNLQAQLFKALLVDQNADWTVTGEALISPSSMAELLNPDKKATTMLWEWRPPYFDNHRGQTILERRPFVSIARIPSSFKKQLNELIDKAHPGSDNTARVESLLTMLGSKGVGLSSLLSMGGTHASGALGFYLAFALAEKLEANDGNTFVLPLDACDSFLRALAGKQLPENVLKRADLLMIRLTDTHLKFVPIEIKLYGLGATVPSTVLPNHGDNSLEEAISQLQITTELLQIIQTTAGELKNLDNADTTIWFNALTTLLEAAAKLSPPRNDQGDTFQNRLLKVVDGDISIEVGKPLVSYFAHTALTEDGEAHRTYKGETHGALIANISQAFTSTDEQVNKDNLVTEWNDLVDWAFSNSSAVEEEKQEEKEEQTVISVTGPAPSTVEDEELENSHVLTQPEPNEVPEPAPTISSTCSKDQTGIKFPVGKSLGRLSSDSVDFWPGNTMLNQMNIGVVGDLGTGKTQLLKALIAKIRKSANETQKNPLSFLIFDYKDDYQDPEFIDSVGGKVLKPESIPLNIFQLDGEYTPNLAYKKAQGFCDVITKIYSGVGPVQKNILLETITNLYADNQGKAPTLSEVKEAYKAAQNGVSDSVVGIINQFVLPGVFSENPEEMMTFSELLEDKVLVVALSELGVDNNTKNALVVLFLNLYYDYMLKAEKWPFEGDQPNQIRKINSFLLVDEATNIMSYNFPVLSQLLLQGRQFGIGVILATQYLSHYKTSENNYGQPLLTWFIHKVPSVTLKDLSAIGLKTNDQQVPNQIMALRPHEAYYSSYKYPGVFMRGEPFFELIEDSK